MPLLPDLGLLAQEILAARDEARPIECFTARWPGFDEAAAYAVSRRVQEAQVARGAVTVGRKIGFTNPDMWAQYGVGGPVWGPVYDRTVEYLPGPRARCALAGLLEPKIEPEIVLHFATAPQATDDPAGILGCIDWIAHGFEVVHSHYPGWNFRAADAIADGGLHARLFVGRRTRPEELGAEILRSLREFTVRLLRNGELQERGKGSNVLGSPLIAVSHLLGVLARQPGAQPLQAGELVTTGTITRAFPVQAGETWSTTLEGIALPGLALDFEA